MHRGRKNNGHQNWRKPSASNERSSSRYSDTTEPNERNNRNRYKRDKKHLLILDDVRPRKSYKFNSHYNNNSNRQYNSNNNSNNNNYKRRNRQYDDDNYLTTYKQDQDIEPIYSIDDRQPLSDMRKPVSEEKRRFKYYDFPERPSILRKAESQTSAVIDTNIFTNNEKVGTDRPLMKSQSERFPSWRDKKQPDTTQPTHSTVTPNINENNKLNIDNQSLVITKNPLKIDTTSKSFTFKSPPQQKKTFTAVRQVDENEDNIGDVIRSNSGSTSSTKGFSTGAIKGHDGRLNGHKSSSTSDTNSTRKLVLVTNNDDNPSLNNTKLAIEIKPLNMKSNSDQRNGGIIGALSKSANKLVSDTTSDPTSKEDNFPDRIDSRKSPISNNTTKNNSTSDESGEFPANTNTDVSNFDTSTLKANPTTERITEDHQKKADSSDQQVLRPLDNSNINIAKDKIVINTKDINNSEDLEVENKIIESKVNTVQELTNKSKITTPKNGNKKADRDEIKKSPCNTSAREEITKEMDTNFFVAKSEDSNDQTKQPEKSEKLQKPLGSRATGDRSINSDDTENKNTLDINTNTHPNKNNRLFLASTVNSNNGNSFDIDAKDLLKAKKLVTRSSTAQDKDRNITRNYKDEKNEDTLNSSETSGSGYNPMKPKSIQSSSKTVEEKVDIQSYRYSDENTIGSAALDRHMRNKDHRDRSSVRARKMLTSILSKQLELDNITPTETSQKMDTKDTVIIVESNLKPTEGKPYRYLQNPVPANESISMEVSPQGIDLPGQEGRDAYKTTIDGQLCVKATSNTLANTDRVSTNKLSEQTSSEDPQSGYNHDSEREIRSINDSILEKGEASRRGPNALPRISVIGEISKNGKTESSKDTKPSINENSSYDTSRQIPTTPDEKTNSLEHSSEMGILENDFSDSKKDTSDEIQNPNFPRYNKQTSLEKAADNSKKDITSNKEMQSKIDTDIQSKISNVSRKVDPDNISDRHHKLDTVFKKPSKITKLTNPKKKRLDSDENIKAQIEKMKASKIDMENHVIDLSEEVLKYELRVSALLGKISEMENDRKGLASAYNGLCSNINSQMKQIQSLPTVGQKLIESAKKCVDRSTTNSLELSKDVIVGTDTKGLVSSELRSLESRILDRTREYKKYVDLLEEKEKLNSQENIDDLQVSVESPYVKQLKEKLLHTREDFKDLQRTTSKRISNLNIAISKMHSDNMTLQTDLENKKNYFAKMSNYISKSNENITQYKASVEEKDATIISLRKQLEQQENNLNVNEFNSRINNLTKENAEIALKFNKLFTAYKQLYEQYTLQQSKVKESIVKIQKEQSSNKQLSKVINEQNGTIRELTSRSVGSGRADPPSSYWKAQFEKISKEREVEKMRHQMELTDIHKNYYKLLSEREKGFQQVLQNMSSRPFSMLPPSTPSHIDPRSKNNKSHIEDSQGTAQSPSEFPQSQYQGLPQGHQVQQVTERTIQSTLQQSSDETQSNMQNQKSNHLVALNDNQDQVQDLHQNDARSQVGTTTPQQSRSPLEKRDEINKTSTEHARNESQSLFVNNEEKNVVPHYSTYMPSTDFDITSPNSKTDEK